MKKITPFLWFDTRAEEAAKYYVSIFKNSKIHSSSPASVMFNLDGQEFIALNGGPQFKFTEAISMYVDCNDQEEVDYFWEKLSLGGSKRQCGWLKDKFGLSWQIIPKQLGQLMNDRDSKKAERVMQAMLKMGKIDIKKLEEAYNQKK
jgi:predicted 3-demethylubiquinone-9 3-methyltransferase (glyoxalase superfamily)